jgi:hypothetical protein
MPLDLGRDREDGGRVVVDAQVEQHRGQDDARDRRGRRRAEAARERDTVPREAVVGGDRERHPPGDGDHHPSDQVRSVHRELVGALAVPHDPCGT